MHAQLVDHPVLGRLDQHAPVLVVGGDLALAQFGQAVLHVVQLVAGVGAGLLAQLEDLQLDLGDLSLGLGGLRPQLGDIGVQLHLRPLQRVQPGQGHQVLGVELAHAGQLLLHQHDLLLLGLGLALEAVDLLLQLGHALPQLPLLALPRRQPQLIEPRLVLHRGGDGRILAALVEVGRPA